MKSTIFQSTRWQSTRWVKTLAVSFSLALLMAVASPVLGRQDIPQLPKPGGSDEMPELIVPMLNGGPVKLSSFRGRVVIIDFFRSNCPHCQQHAPHMAQIYNQFSDRGLTILGLAGDLPEESQNVRAFVREYKLRYPIGFITTETLAYYADSHDHGVPQFVLFGTDGKMVRRWIGWDEKNGKELLAAVQEQVQKAGAIKPAPKPTVKPAAKSGIKSSSSTRRRTMNGQ